MLAPDATRRLAGFAVNRIASTPINIVYLTKVFQEDGSFQTVERIEKRKCFLTNLTDSEIERLREGGITVTTGASVSIVGELVEIPNEFRIGASRFRAVKYSIAQGVSNFTLEQIPLGVQIVELGALVGAFT